ncbi:MAG: hypothetical protein ACD_39C00379G0003 [uncultured bacterium]|nr:MAG: hypothetical protein ACD_39C00379G0003 [uncultured bacterium]
MAAVMLLAGFGPRPYSDLAEYKRLPQETRISRLQSAAEDLFRRRRYEDAVQVFSTILALDESDLKAKLWIVKARTEIKREQDEFNKQERYRRYGQLIPKLKDDLLDDAALGYFEVRYSEPKPYVRPVRKIRPPASDADIAEAAKKAESSGVAADYFELAMQHWSRKNAEPALKAYFKAVSLDGEILSLDDEQLLMTVSAEVEKLVETGKVSAAEYLNSGKLLMVQGELRRAVSHLVKAAELDEKVRQESSDILLTLIESPQIDLLSAPPDLLGFRQAYVFDKDSDTVYVRVNLIPKNRGQIVPIDITISADAVKKIESRSKDVAMAFGKPGVDNALRVWAILPEKDEKFPEYELRLAISIDRNILNYLDLSNYSLPAEMPDNWSFIIGSEFNFSENVPKGEYEKKLEGLQINGFHLTASEGKGPTLLLSDFKEPLPRKLDIWKIIETGGEGVVSNLF